MPNEPVNNLLSFLRSQRAKPAPRSTDLEKRQGAGAGAKATTRPNAATPTIGASEGKPRSDIVVGRSDPIPRPGQELRLDQELEPLQWMLLQQRKRKQERQQQEQQQARQRQLQLQELQQQLQEQQQQSQQQQQQQQTTVPNACNPESARSTDSSSSDLSESAVFNARRLAAARRRFPGPQPQPTSSADDGRRGNDSAPRNIDQHDPFRLTFPPRLPKDPHLYRQFEKPIVLKNRPGIDIPSEKVGVFCELVQRIAAAQEERFTRYKEAMGQAKAEPHLRPPPSLAAQAAAREILLQGYPVPLDYYPPSPPPPPKPLVTYDLTPAEERLLCPRGRNKELPPSSRRVLQPEGMIENKWLPPGIKVPAWYVVLEEQKGIEAPEISRRHRYAYFMERYTQLNEGIEEDDETNKEWNKEYHNPGPDWPTDLQRRQGGWWRCREGPEAPEAERTCKACHRRRPRQDGNAKMQRMRALRDNMQREIARCQARVAEWDRKVALAMLKAERASADEQRCQERWKLRNGFLDAHERPPRVWHHSLARRVPPDGLIGPHRQQQPPRQR